MPFVIPIDEAAKKFPEYQFIKPLTPSAQKCAFHVRDISGNDLCLKIISPNYRMERLEREIDALSKISHPNIVEFVQYEFCVSKSNPRHFMIERFIAGDDLKLPSESKYRWDESKAAKFFAQLFDGLGEFKRHNLVHRDIKPSNIRVHSSGRPIIIDLGLARHLDLPDLTNTSDGAAIGTMLYFSPEQFVGTKRDIDHRTDLFAMGLLLYQALTAQHPFYQNGMSGTELEKSVCNSVQFTEHVIFRSLSPTMIMIVSKLLSKQREQRPNDAELVAKILRKVGQ